MITENVLASEIFLELFYYDIRKQCGEKTECFTSEKVQNITWEATFDAEWRPYEYGRYLI